MQAEPTGATAHIEDPTLKVKAPTSLLSALGNTYINLIFAAHNLERLLVVITNCSWEDHPEDETSPTSVIGYAQANQKLSWRIEDLRRRLEDAVGQFEWGKGEDGEPGQLVRVGNRFERAEDEAHTRAAEAYIPPCDSVRSGDLVLTQLPTRNSTVTKFEARYKDYLIPDTEILCWPAAAPIDQGGGGQQVYMEKGDDWWVRVVGPDQTEEMPVDFEPFYIWSITIDNRLSWDFASEREVCSALRMLADGMAISAGFASHGCSNKLNRHGPVIQQDQPSLTPEAVDPDVRSAVDNGDGTWTVNGIRYKPVPQGERPKPHPGAGKPVPQDVLDEEAIQIEIERRWREDYKMKPPRVQVEDEVRGEW